MPIARLDQEPVLTVLDLQGDTTAVRSDDGFTFMDGF